MSRLGVTSVWSAWIVPNIKVKNYEIKEKEKKEEFLGFQ